MTIEENIKIINQIIDHQHVIDGFNQRLREDAAQVTVCACGYGTVHIYSGIDVLAKALSCSLDASALRSYGHDMIYPYKVSFCHGGVAYYQLMTADDYKTFAANSAVSIDEGEIV